MRWFAFMLSLVMLQACWGCKPRAARTSATSAAAPAGRHPTTAGTQPATQPAASFMRINGRIFEFPPARLKLENDGQSITALLFSDDPPQAIKDTYSGNSFYLEMPLPIANAADLSLAAWRHQARSQERQDTPFGIYLDGRKVQLQPYNVSATFTPGDEHGEIVHLTGQFLLWNNADVASVPQTVFLSAELPVRVESDAQASAVH